ncbi:MAG: cytochrome C [Acidobacteriales bacterium]|nr:MAG: cytochrome C [Terriglobales bacterium]
MGGWLLPVIHLSNNVLSMTGVLLVTTSTVFWLFLLPSSFGAPVNNPYLGIVAYLLLPSVLVLGLILIPIGIYLRFRSERKKGSYPSDFPPLTFHNVEFRRLILFVTLATLVNIVIAGQTGYKAVTYMEGASFCGETCHVMQPEFVAYKNAAHSRVECVKCHIGPGAAWFLRSKLNGIHQVFAVTFNTYQRPIPPPLQKLRPASETCEECHAPDKFIGDRLRVIDKFADDEKNTTAKTVLLMRVGGARQGTGIHGVHMGPGVTVRYAPADESRQKITWVEYNNGRGRKATYALPDAKPGAAGKLPVRDMECMDCHNRPAHTFEVPESAVDRAMALGQIAPDLPFIKKQSVELLKASYPASVQVDTAIPAALDRFYRESHPAVFASRRADVARAGVALAAIHGRNVFPAMKVTWGTYPNNLGHNDFPGCFRCHGGALKSADESTISQDCNTCHQLLAMEEPAPKVLADLGLAPAASQQ